MHPGELELPGNLADEDCDGVRACDPAAVCSNRGAYVRCVVERGAICVPALVLTGRPREG